MARRFIQARRALLATSIIAGGVIAEIPQVALAQEAPAGDTMARADETPVHGEIVVTAQRRNASLQNTAAAISAVSAEALEAQAINSLESLGVALPGVQISQYQGDSSIFVRGIGTPIIVGGSESSTSTYVDGVYISRPSTAGVSFFDLESVQILRGPQGTLYGRNATGGSVLLTTRAPSSRFGGEAKLTVGNYGRVQVFGAIEGPLAGDQLTGRLAVQLERRDGYTDVTYPDGSVRDVEDKKDITARASLQFRPTDGLTLDLVGDYYHANDAANVFQYVGRGYADLLPDPQQYYTSFFPTIQPWLSLVSAGRQSQPLSRDEFGDLDYFNEPTIWGLTGKLTYEFSDYSFQANTSYRDTKTRFLTDIDVTDAFASSLLRGEDHWQFSQDIQLNSPEGDRFKWIVGASYFKDENAVDNEFEGPFFPLIFQGLAAQLPFLDVPTTGYDAECCELRLNGTTKTEAVAAFVDTRFAVTDQITLAAGVRYSHETRDGTQEFGVYGSPVPDPLLGALGFFNVADLDEVSFSSWTPKFAIEFRPSDTLFLYGSASKGFKSGGFNIGSPQNTPFNPETIWSYEVGARAELFDRRLRMGLLAFKYDYSDLQVQDSVGQSTIIRNAGSADIKGLEFDAVARVTNGFQIDFSAAWLDAKFGNFALAEPNRPVIYNPFTPAVAPVAAPLIDLTTGQSYAGSEIIGFDPVFGLVPVGAPPGITPGDPFVQSYEARVSLAGNRLPRAPEWKINVGAQYTAELGHGSLTLRGDYAWQDRIFFTAYNLPTVAQDDFGLLNGRVTYESAGGGWQVAAFINNASNTKALTNAVITGQVYGGIVIGNLLPPRTFGMEVSFSF